jgi:hypothetical protein
VQDLGREAVADAGDRADGAAAQEPVEHLRVDADQQEQVVVGVGDVLGRAGEGIGAAELLEADEVAVVAAQLEEERRSRLEAVVGAVVDHGGEVGRGAEDAADVVALGVG